MIFFLLSFYIIFFDDDRNADSLFIYNVWEENDFNILSFEEPEILGNVFYPCYGKGRFTITNITDSAYIYYLYNIHSKQLSELYILYLDKQKRVSALEDKEILPMREGLLINDTLLLVGGTDLKWYGYDQKYHQNNILYINPVKNKIIKLVSVPEAEVGPKFRAYSKKNDLLAFKVSGLESCNLCGKVCLLDVKKGEVVEISQGYIYPKIWLNDSLLIIVDETEHIEKMKRLTRDDPIPKETYVDFLVYNIHTRNMKKIKDDSMDDYIYTKGKELYFIKIQNDYKNKKVEIIIKDSSNNVILSRIFPQPPYRRKYLIPYPEN
jgi:hypothetical protein